MFNEKKLICTSNELSILQKNYEYFSKDDVTEKGYFPKKSGIKDGDLITVVSIDKLQDITETYERKTYYMTQDLSGTLTAVIYSSQEGEEADLQDLENKVNALMEKKTVVSDDVTKMVKTTQEAYDALEEKDQQTFYIITEE